MMPCSFAVVCEAEADFRTATGLAERIVRENVDWIEGDSFIHCPLWSGLDESSRYLLWFDIPKLAKEAGIRSHGHFDGRPAEPDAHAARRALRLLKWKNAARPLDGVLLIRDDDRDARRRDGLEQARDDDHDLRDRIVIGLAHCKRECWVLAGFDPRDQVESDRLSEVRADLGFDPRTGAHQLTVKGKGGKRNAKEILDKLTGGDANREAICWEEASLLTLHDRGQETGLADFLEEIRSRLVPLFAGRPPG
jgi:hypothetical protein